MSHRKKYDGHIRRRLAWVSPLPPAESGIALDTVELLSYLDGLYEQDVYTDQVPPEGVAGLAAHEVLPWHKLPARAADYDLIIYQMGNSSFHTYMLQLQQSIPGLLLLHDFWVSDLLSYCVESPWRVYREEAFYSHGWQGLAVQVSHTTATSVRQLPCNKRLLDSAFGVVFNSQYNLEQCREFYGEDYAGQLQSAVIPMRILRRASLDARDCSSEAIKALRMRYGYSSEDFLVVTCGVVTERKLGQLLVQAMAIMERRGQADRVKLIFAGNLDEGSFSNSLRQMVAGLADSSRVTITGYLDDEAYLDYIQMADLAVQLRKETRGETSGVIPECAMLGTPVLVNAYATFNDYPNAVVRKVSERPSAEELADAIDSLHYDETGRLELARNAREYILEQRSRQSITDMYVEAIEGAIARSQESGYHSFLRETAEVMSQCQTLDGDYAYVAECYARNHAAPGYRRVYACLAEEQISELQDTCPDALRKDPLCEFVPCRYDSESGRFVVDIWTLAKGSEMAYPINFTQDDCLLLPLERLEKEQARQVVEQMASLYVIGDDSQLNNMDAELKSWLSGCVHGDRLSDFWSTDWALTEPLPGKGRLLIDSSYFTYGGDGHGIHRLCHNMDLAFLGISQEAVLVRTVNGKLVTNRRYAARLQGEANIPQEAPVIFQPGDVLFLLDPSIGWLNDFRLYLRRLHEVGGRSYAIIHDLFAIIYPHFFGLTEPDEGFRCWHEFIIQECDGIICNSRATADSVESYTKTKPLFLPTPTELHYFPCGATKLNEKGDVRPFLQKYLEEDIPVFLMVGTIEPRKGHETAIKAFQKLWQQGGEARLMIIGHKGWQCEKVLRLMISDKHYGRELIWLDDASDADLAYCYRYADCLLAASYDEGFGSPLVEAAEYGLPLLCSDIPVFHEVSQEQAEFFPAFDEDGLCSALSKWLKTDKHEHPRGIRVTGWQESTEAVLNILQGNQVPYKLLK